MADASPLDPQVSRPRSLALVLGGGGARGLAHIGACKAIAERGYAIEAIAGCSLGGIVGALLGSGHAADAIARMVDEIHVHDLLDFGAMGGMIGGKGIARVLAEHVREDFADLDIPLKVTTVDVQRGALVILGAGPLVPALRATSALPGILSPVEYGDLVLMDGGLLNNLPVDVVSSMSIAPVLAVDVGAPPNRRLDFEESGVLDTIKRLTRREFRTLTVELFMKSFDIPQRLITETRLAMDPPEILVRPDLPVDFGVEDVHRLEEAVALGYEATHAALGRWEAGHMGPTTTRKG